MGAAVRSIARDMAGYYTSLLLAGGTLSGAGDEFGGRGRVARRCDRARADWSADVNLASLLLSARVMFGRGVPLPRVPDHLRAAEASPEGHADLS